MDKSDLVAQLYVDLCKPLVSRDTSVQAFKDAAVMANQRAEIFLSTPNANELASKLFINLCAPYTSKNTLAETIKVYAQLAVARAEHLIPAPKVSVVIATPVSNVGDTETKEESKPTQGQQQKRK